MTTSPRLGRIELETGSLDLDAGVLLHADGPRYLTEREVGLVRLLWGAEGRPVLREQIAGRLWHSPPQANTLDRLVSRVRKKLEPQVGVPVHLRTVRGVGFRLVPVEVPPTDGPTLLGRAQLVRTVQDRVALGSVALVGPGGIGKSRVAFSAFPPEAYRHLTLRGCRDPQELFQRIRSALQLGSSARTAEAMAQKLVRGGWSPVILDDVEGVPDSTLDAIAAMVARGARLLLLSRRSFEIEGVVEIEVPSLGDGAALELFRHRADGEVSDGVAGALCKALGNHPLAIELAACRTHLRSPETLLAAAEQSNTSAFRGGLDDAERRHTSLAASIEHTLAGLDPECHRAAEAIALFDEGVTLQRLALVLDCAVAEVRSSIAQLQSWFLCGSGWPVRLHPMVMDCVAERVGPELRERDVAVTVAQAHIMARNIDPVPFEPFEPTPFEATALHRALAVVSVGIDQAAVAVCLSRAIFLPIDTEPLLGALGADLDAYWESRVCLSLGRMCARAGDLEGASRSFDRAIACGELDVRLASEVGRQLGYLEDAGTSTVDGAWIDDASRRAEAHGLAYLHLRLLFLRAIQLKYQGEPHQAVDKLFEVQALARPLGFFQFEMIALSHLTASPTGDRTGEVVDAMLRMARRMRALGAEVRACVCESASIEPMLRIRLPKRVPTYIDNAVRSLQRTGPAPLEANARLNYADVLHVVGRLDDALHQLDEVDELERISASTGNLSAISRAHIHLERGEVEEATRRIDGMAIGSDRTGAMVALTWIVAHLCAARPEAAHEVLRVMPPSEWWPLESRFVKQWEATGVPTVEGCSDFLHILRRIYRAHRVRTDPRSGRIQVVNG